MIVQLEEAKQQLGVLKGDAAELKDALSVEELSAKVKELEEATCAEEGQIAKPCAFCDYAEIVGQIPKTYEDGWLKFRVGPNFAGMYYLIMQE